MEDQPTDSGDLTADADAASVPLGKSARTRHRLPRQKVRSTGDGDQLVVDETPEVVEEAPEKVDETSEAPDVTPEKVDETPEPVDEAEPAKDERALGETAEPAATPRRRRWRRAKAVDDVPAVDADVPADADVATAELEPEPILVPHRPAGRVLKAAAVAAGVLFVAAGAFAGATLQPYLADRAAVQIKFQIAETAANAITTLWTYTPDDMEQLPERSARYLGGDFATDYQRYIDAIAAPNKQAQVTNNTQVLGAAVESLSSSEATAIVYTNSVATSPVTKGIPSLRYLSYRLTMKRDDDRWLITQMVAVTKLDLTPRL